MKTVKRARPTHAADPAGWRDLAKRRWTAPEESLDAPVVVPADPEAVASELSVQLGERLRDPRLTALVEAEHRRRLESLVAWVAKLHGL